MKQLLLFFAAIVVYAKASAYQQDDSVHIYFDLNKESITKLQQKKIDSLLYNDVLNDKINILIVGYADFLGSEEHNLGLSERRAKTIQQYLTDMQIPAQNIRLCIGKGEVNRDSKSIDGYAPDRRVDIVYSRTPSQQSAQKIKHAPPRPKSRASIMQF